MKRRVLQTYKILAVAVAAAAAGCSSAEPPAVVAEAPSPPAPQPPAAAAAPAQPPAAALGPSKAEIQALLGEMISLTREEALARFDHFRPLCDKDGYPLVGNLNRKGPGPEFQPSMFCGEVRARAAK